LSTVEDKNLATFWWPEAAGVPNTNIRSVPFYTTSTSTSVNRRYIFPHKAFIYEFTIIPTRVWVGGVTQIIHRLWFFDPATGDSLDAVRYLTHNLDSTRMDIKTFNLGSLLVPKGTHMFVDVFQTSDPAKLLYYQCSAWGEFLP